MIQSVKKADIKFVLEGICPFCQIRSLTNVGQHIRNEHGIERYESTVLKAKEEGIPDPM